jgi:hypothetical protein
MLKNGQDHRPRPSLKEDLKFVLMCPNTTRCWALVRFVNHFVQYLGFLAHLRRFLASVNEDLIVGSLDLFWWSIL